MLSTFLWRTRYVIMSVSIASSLFMHCRTISKHSKLQNLWTFLRITLLLVATDFTSFHHHCVSNQNPVHGKTRLLSAALNSVRSHFDSNRQADSFKTVEEPCPSMSQSQHDAFWVMSICIPHVWTMLILLLYWIVNELFSTQKRLPTKAHFLIC